MSTSQVSSVRRIVIRLTVGSFSLAALMGVAALLRPGHFGSTESRVLLTTLVVGVTSVLMLCYLASSGERTRFVGVIGAVAALTSATCALVMFWAWWQESPPTALARGFGVSGVLALTLAQVSLLLAVVRRRPSVVRLLVATVVTASILTALVVAVILGWSPGETAARLIGVVAILDVLGTVVTMALGVFGGETPSGAPGSLGVTLPPAVAEAVRARGSETGRSADEVVLDAVRAYVASDADADADA